MNDGDVLHQVQQMAEFIRQEAHEKSNEISVSAEEEFNIEKLQLVEAEKKKIRQEYERKFKQVEVRRKIEYSMQLNASRIKFLQAQDELVNAMKEATSKELLRVSDDRNAHTYKLLFLPFSDDKNANSYKKLLQALIVQGLLRLQEPSVLVRCREMDRKAVESVLEDSKRIYAEKANVRTPSITIDKVYLPPPSASDDHHAPSCSGGVVLASRDGKIVCENTLDARLDMAFRQKLPEIRNHIFG